MGWFGLLSGGKIRSGSFRLLCLLMVQCKTLRQAIIRLGEFSRVCRGFKISVKLEVIDDVAHSAIEPVEGVSDEEFQTILNQANPAKIRHTMATSQRLWSWLIGS